ncbi:MAG: hypothetical protein M0R47_15830 [Methylobacter sp.]|uniref:hypothetical protein n=1 Tax=Methylobacter sp. TaxID=2051955 RepID=UPI0025D2F7D0|nr:hypothetical protein [Methylobacter sp.]MCK9621990.1 hypothetical protein [Methylobacter sp.]
MLPEIEEHESHDFEVFKENMPVLEAFFVLEGSAWKYTGMGDLIGLDVQAAKIIWDYLQTEITPDIFRGIMLFTNTVTQERGKQRSKK